MLHVPLLSAILLGLLLVHDEATSGYWLSLLLSGLGVFAFVLHVSLIVRGRPEFREDASIGILVLTLAVSLAQGAVTLMEWR